MNSIQIKNIRKTYGETVALDDVSFDVKSGELFGLIGPDGAGKTSLLRILVSLLLPDAGDASLCELDVVSSYKKIRELVGYMPGRFSLYQDLTVEENLNFFATVFGTTIEQNYDLVKDIYSHIEPFKNRRAGKLSGGMKQKLALSCALIHKPNVLILDEPTTGVDAVSRKEFWEMLKKLRDKGLTILVSTPYMDEASMCNRVALIQNGKIMQVNTPSEVIKNFPTTLFSIKAHNLYDVLKVAREKENTKTAFLFGQEIHYTDMRDNADSNTIKSELQENHMECEVAEIKPNIEDCFMELMSMHK